MPTQYQEQPAKSFDDVLLIPRHNRIESRLDVDLTTRLTKKTTLKHPICSTNMSTITEERMMEVMWDSGSVGFLHRFLPTDDLVEIMRWAVDKVEIKPLAISVGVRSDSCIFLSRISKNGPIPDIILVDVAHGDSASVRRMVRHIGGISPDIEVIAGNVATASGALYLVDAGVDAVRVGIGGSSVCTTRQVTGHGVPTLQSIEDVKNAFVKRGIDVPIIADGGFRTSGDIVKALAFGAESVTLGTLLAGTACCPTSGSGFRFYGMSSKEAQDTYRGGKREGVAAEGIERLIPYRGETTDVLDELLGGIRSGLTYSGVGTIEELYEQALYRTLTSGAQRESYVRETGNTTS